MDMTDVEKQGINTAAEKKKPLCFYVLATVNILFLLLSISLFVWSVMSAYHGNFIQEPPEPAVIYIWEAAIEELVICTLLTLSLVNLLRVDAKKYRLFAYILLLLAMRFAPRLIISDIGSIVGAVAPFVLYLILLYLAYRYIKKSKSLKAYFGEE